MSHLLIRGDARRLALADRSVQCVVTSPPYFGLRDYGSAGQIGLEPTPDLFVAAMVGVFRELRRVLRDDGVAWLNLGDSYATNPGNGRGGEGSGLTKGGRPPHRSATDRSTLGNKQLLGVPWRVALALQADGWVLRQAAPWVKRAAMPESVTDRPSSSVEYVFLLTKKPRYFYDSEAVRKPSATAEHHERYHEASANYRRKDPPGQAPQSNAAKAGCHPAGRNRRNGEWWFESIAAAVGAGPAGMVAGPDGEVLGFDVTHEPCSYAHFATMPTRLVEPMIRAGSSEAGACCTCGSPFERVVERTPSSEGRKNWAGCEASKGGASRNGGFYDARSETTGWRPTCPCDDPRPPRPCLIFDPFAGSGTTVLTARRLGRAAAGCDLSAEYLALAARRIAEGLRPVSKLDPAPGYRPLPGQLSLFAEA